MDIKVQYLHSDIDTLERVRIIRELRLGVFDVLVGINLLREGLDLPEVSMVAIMDADREGFLRSETSLIQTMGRAARNVEGQAILYADVITNSIKRAMAETRRRRTIQISYNNEHGITPESVRSRIHDVLSSVEEVDYVTLAQVEGDFQPEDLQGTIKALEAEMMDAATRLEFERAAEIRDRIRQLEGRQIMLGAPARTIQGKGKKRKKQQ